ncbi:b(0,+)-type amino acid transporter 1-like [Montipora foliosa]|uniref:b(0,+)-type amino acid transporter 1-like n=1 Tax=Montipora foliosa TaxID=591990 RepID=UPI0035F1B7DA
MPPVPVLNEDIGEKLANESTSSESLNQSNSMDKAEEPFLADEEKGENSERIQLKKNVTLINGIGLIVGTVIGSGIFVSPTSILEETNSIGASLLIWLGCGLIGLFGSLCYAELGTFIKKSGGEYAYLMEAFGRIPAFLFTWTSVLIIRPASGAIIALTFAEYVSKPFYPDCEAPTYLVKLLACSCLVILTAINCWSVKWATRIQDIFTYAKLLCILMITIIGFVELGKGKTGNFKDSFKGSTTDIGKIGMAFYLGLWAYDGWNNLNYCTEEMKHPERDMPRAITIGLSLTTVCYLVVNVAYITVLGKAGILSSEAVAVSVGKLYLGPVHWIIPVFVACSTFGAVNGLLFTSGRLVYVAARDGLMPRLLAMINVKRFTPLPSLFFTTIVSVLMLIPEASSFTTLVDFFSFAAWLFYGATFAALLWLRRTQANVARPYKIFIVVPIVMVLASIYLVVAPITTDPKGSMIALAIVLAGLPFYWLFVVSNHAPKFILNATDKFTVWCQRVGNMAFEDPETLPVEV